MKTINSLEQLQEIYGEPRPTSIRKVVDSLTDDYQKYIEASPFAVLATAGATGLDCSPRGDSPGFAKVTDSRHLQIPDRQGNNRVDSLRNILEDSRVGLIFLIPGCSTTLRVNGTATICVEPEVLKAHQVAGKSPRSVLEITIQEVFFQCGRALIRSDLWNPQKQIVPEELPSVGQILDRLTNGELGGREYDRKWPSRAQQTLW